VCIYAETRADWIVSMFACFKANLPGICFIVWSKNAVFGVAFNGILVVWQLVISSDPSLQPS